MPTTPPYSKLYRSSLWLIMAIIMVHRMVFTAAETCPQDQFVCNNGACIHSTWRCDGDLDCLDGEDEDHCDLVSCSANTFTCANGKCIAKTWRCDGENDCGDGSDEINCANMFTCANGKCIAKTWRCDGDHDCRDGSDEMNCDTTDRPVCDVNSFRCDDGTCILERWRCDGDADCPDKSDEANCTNMFTCANGKCIAKTWRCDGDRDCRDGSDEINCDRPVCDANSFRCDDGTCILERWRCDGDGDCSDMSDEANCNPCETYGFLCLSGECTSKDFVCDGVGDCRDSSDELNCDSRTTTIKYTREEPPKTTKFISRQMTSTPTTGFRTTKTPTKSSSSVPIPTPTEEILSTPMTEMLSTISTKLTTTRSNTFIPYRLEGRVAGMVNGKPLEQIKMSCHGTDQWKSYVSFHPVPQSLMTSLYPLLVEMTSLMGWMLVAKEEISGFAFTEGKCTRRVHISFETGDNVTMLQKFQGKTGQSIAVNTFIEGTVPATEQVHHQRIWLDNVDRYTRLYPGMLYSSTTRQFKIGDDIIKYTSEQHVSFDALLAKITMESKGELTMNISDVTIIYDNITNIARLGLATHITMPKERQSFTTIQPIDPGHSQNDLYIYVAIAGSMTAVFIVVIGVTCLVKRRRTKTNREIPDCLPSSQIENRAYMEMGSAAIYEEIPSRAFDTDYVSPDDITCHRDQDISFTSSRAINEYSDMNYEAPKTNSHESCDHKPGLNNNKANMNMKENGVFRDRASSDKYYLSPCHMGTNGEATGNIEEDDYMKPVQSMKQ